jgi:hypothetical protein
MRSGLERLYVRRVGPLGPSLGVVADLGAIAERPSVQYATSAPRPARGGVTLSALLNLWICAFEGFDDGPGDSRNFDAVVEPDSGGQDPRQHDETRLDGRRVTEERRVQLGRCPMHDDAGSDRKRFERSKHLPF